MSSVPWDNLPHPLKKGNDKVAENKPKVVEEEDSVHEFDIQKDVIAIGRRVAFGAVCGVLTGASFGFVDVLRDPKLMTAKKSLATAKIIRYSTYFGGFFASYHGLRHTLKLYYPQSKEENIATAGFVTLLPILLVPRYRNLLPYGVMLVALDGIEE